VPAIAGRWSFPRAKPVVLNALAGVLWQLGRQDDVLECLGQLLTLRPGDIELLHRRADMLREMKRFDRVLKDYDAVLAVHPNLAETLTNRGFTLRAKPIKIPYRANRAVIFDSNLFHKIDEIAFAEGHENRRINITMLYGRRRRA